MHVGCCWGMAGNRRFLMQNHKPIHETVILTKRATNKFTQILRAPQVNESEIIGARVNSSRDVAPRFEENAASRCSKKLFLSAYFIVQVEKYARVRWPIDCQS